ncbi:MAPK regulated corepressor interacting protein 2-like isoform X5 [Babylonia areolata]|uniref:MAPK regulated corepressor interacting protein 2-like isoform X5 n=1 Tax=Babylonia areolata TaxID=304850 RepID=UPI003FD6199E
MYALPRGPSKIVASTRRGHSRAFDFHENSRHQTEKVDSEATMSAVARPVFNHNHNGRMRNQPRPNGNDGIAFVSRNHQEAVNFLFENWNRALRDYNKHGSADGGPEWYRQREPNPANFKKFDLDEYWGKKTMSRVTESS